MAIPNEPQSRIEQYLTNIINQVSAEFPELPQSRIEEYLDFILKNMRLKNGNGTYSLQQMSNEASGQYSFAEGYKTSALGNYSHTEGTQTITRNHNAHAEGNNTVASGSCQHVQGKWNVEDTQGKYAHIVGGGNGVENSTNRRKNIHTLDWDGNAWFNGNIEASYLILKSSTSGSNKRFKITVNDSGTISAVAI